MSSKPKGTWNYVPSENEQKDTWNSVSRPKTEQEVVANNTALEDWYRAQQNGDPNAGQYLMNASVAKADVDRWKNWREQNKTQLDTEYAFKGLDQDVLSLVRDKFKSQWGTKYYYDMFDTEDAFRAQSGRMPKYAEKSYDFSDPYDQWLYQNDLPSRKSFSDMYSQAAFDYNKEQTENNAIVDGIVNDWNGYVDQYGQFQKDYFGAVNAAAAEKGGELTDAEMEEITSRMLTSGKYDGIAGGFTVPEDESEKSALEIYLEGLDVPDYSTYDAMLEALQGNKGIDDAFFDAYKESDYRKWIAGKTAFTQQDLTDAYRANTLMDQYKALDEQGKAYVDTIEAGGTQQEAEEAALLKVDLLDDSARKGIEQQIAKLEEQRTALEKEARSYRLRGDWTNANIAARKAGDITDQIAPLQQKLDANTLTNAQAKAVQELEKYKKIKEKTDFVAKSGTASENVTSTWTTKGLKGKYETLVGKYGADFEPYDENGNWNDAGNLLVTHFLFRTDDEIATLNYIANTQDEAAVKEYIDKLEPVLKMRQVKWETKAYEEYAEEHPVYGSMASVLGGMASPIEGVRSIASAGESPIDTMYKSPLTRMRTGIRENVSQNIIESNTKPLIGNMTTGDLWSFLYGTGMSMADTGVRVAMFGGAGALGKAASLGMAGLDATSSTIIDQLENGATTNQALGMGVLSGATEIFTEKIGVDRLFDKNSWMAGSFRQLLSNVLKQAGAEATEEAIAEVVNTFSDIIVRADEADIRKTFEAHLANGESESIAFWNTLLDFGLQVGSAAAGGFISGLFFGAGGQINAIRSTPGGMATMQAYNDAKKDGIALSGQLNIELTKDIMSLTVSEETREQLLAVKDAFASQPTAWMTEQGVAVFDEFVKTVQRETTHQTSLNAQRQAKQQKVMSRLTELHNRVTALSENAATVLQNGDLKTHTKLMQQCNEAIKRYTTAFENQQAEAAAEQAKTAEQAVKTEAKVLDAAEKAAKQIPVETEFQKEMAARIDEQLFAQEEPRVRAEWGMDEDSGSIIGELIAGEAKHRVAGMSTDEKRSAIYDMIYGQQEAAMESGDAEAYKAAEAAKDEYDVYYESIKNNGQSAADGDTIMEEMVGGAENETVQKEGAENEAETDGRGNRISRAEPVRGADEKRSEQKDNRSGGIEEKRGAQGDVREVRRSQRKKARGAVSWGEQQDADVRNAVAAFNRKNGTNLSPDSVREAQSVPKTIREIAEVARGITGRDSFFIESDRGMFGGFNTGKRPYIVLSGDTTMDAFNLFHEHAHNIPQLLNAISSMLRDGWISKREYNAYKNSRKRRRAANLGIPVSEVSEESEQTIRTEFACDMLGVYAMQAFCNEDHWSAYGIDAETIGSIKQTLDEALAANAITETDAETVEREFSTLEEAGRAISEAEAKGETRFSENSERITKGMPDEERAAILSKKRITVAKGKKDSKILSSDYELLNSLRGSSLEKEIKNIIKRINVLSFPSRGQDIGVDYSNKDIDIRLKISGRDVSESWTKSVTKNVDVFVRVIENLGEIVKNAELIKVQKDRYEGVLYPDRRFDNLYVFLGIMEDKAHNDDTVLIPVRIEIREPVNTKTGNIYVVLDLEGIEKEAFNVEISPANTRVSKTNTSAQASSDYNIADVVRNVKDSDGSLLKYIPTSILTGEQQRIQADAILREREYIKGKVVEELKKAVTKGRTVKAQWLRDSLVRNFEDDVETKFDFSENTPTKKQERLKKAWELFDDGATPQDYYAESGSDFDLKTNNLLRGLMLRNGENVGGALADNSMQRVTEIFSRAKKRLAAGLTLSSPVRVFEDVTGWGGSTAEERANNIKDGNFLKNTYYEYGNVQAANREAWIAEKMRPVMQAITQNGEYGVFESAVTQMLGEGIITKDQAENAVCDGKTMIIEAVDGVFVLDGKGRMLYSSDSRTATHYIDMPIAKRAENAIRKKSKGELAKHVVKRELPPLKVVRDGNTVTVNKDNGEVVAQVAGGTKPNMQAVRAAVAALRTFYADAYKEIAAARVENGYAPPGYIENYFPHQSRTYDGIEGFIEAMTANDLPTAINGRTGMFSPGQPWNANLQSRLGEFTEFDAVRGFNRYVKGAGDTIFYTPVIQRLRQLEKAVRMLDETQLTAEGQKRNSAFADWVHEYANEWANKKASFDREVESLVGREGYSVSNMLTGLVSASAVGGNISSALSNIISGLTGYAQVDGKHVLREVIRTIGQLHQANSKNGQYDGFVNEIPFLQRRFSENEDILLREVDKFKRKGSKAMYCLFSALDRFSVESVARAKYAECIDRGMTKEQAIEATNDMLIKNFADRGKGQSARIFNVKWLKPVAQFQLEVLNQMNHFRDMNRAEVEAKLYDLEKQYANGIPFDEIAVEALSSGGMRKLKKVMAYLVLLSLWGMVTRALMGRDQTWNPAGMAMDAVDDFREGGMKQVAAGIGETLTENVPFVSMLTEGGRVPLAGNITNVTDIIQAIWNDETESLSNADWIKGATSFVPGGGQLRKIINGIEANAKGGYYTDKGNLRYPVEPKDWFTSALFGPSAAAPKGYEWGDTLSAKETEAYETLTDQGLDGSDLYDTLVNMNTVTGSKSEKALSLLANRNDFDDEEVNMIAAALGIEYKGSLESYAEKSAEKYLKDKRNDVKEGEITQEKYDEIESVFDEYFRLLGMAN